MQTTARNGFARAGREILSRVDSQLTRRGIQPVGSKPADPLRQKGSEPLRENEERMEDKPEGEEGTLPESTEPTGSQPKPKRTLTGHLGQDRVLTSNTVLTQVGPNLESQIHASLRCRGTGRP